MNTKTLSKLKIYTAISFFLILLVSNNLMVLPMFFALLLGLTSIVSGDPSGFIFSCLGLLSSLYLMASAMMNKIKINYYKTGLSIMVLVALAVYSIAESSVNVPIFSLISYLIFFICVLFCLIGFVRRGKGA